MKKTILLCLLGTMLLLGSCQYLFNEIVMPNRCCKCSYYDSWGTDPYNVEEGCGGDMAGVERRRDEFQARKDTTPLMTEYVECESYRVNDEEDEDDI